MAVVIALQWDATYKSRIIPARNMHLLWGLESHARLRLKKKKGWLAVFIWPGFVSPTLLLYLFLMFPLYKLQGSFLTLILPLFLSQISANEIEMLLMRLPRMFKQEFTGVGATLEKRWKFCAFEGIKTV